MKKLSRNEMKNVNGGANDFEISNDVDGGTVECTTQCIYHQAGCSGVDHKACSTGSGAFDWKCC